VFGVIIQVADFGTVRVNAEMTKSDDDKLMTTKARKAASVTHGTTKMLCGTTPYMYVAFKPPTFVHTTFVDGHCCGMWYAFCFRGTRPPEYFGRGHVSEKTDAFALGIIMIELLCGSSPDQTQSTAMCAREWVDEQYSPAEFLQILRSQRQQAEEAYPLGKKKANGRQGHSCEWPEAAFEELSVLALECTQPAPRRRITVCDALPKLQVIATRGI
jgi:serine/threonine protein kinase